MITEWIDSIQSYYHYLTTWFYSLMSSIRPGSHTKAADHIGYHTNATASRQFQYIVDDCNGSENSN